jgi:hypothetical protein
MIHGFQVAENFCPKLVLYVRILCDYVEEPVQRRRGCVRRGEDNNSVRKISTMGRMWNSVYLRGGSDELFVSEAQRLLASHIALH